MYNQIAPIFIETDRVRSSTIPVPEAVSEWSDFLINELYKQHSSLSGRTADVNFQNVDEEQGYATGSIKITDNGRPMINVPFIIEARRLYPLDIFFSSTIDEEPHPLNENRIREVFFHAKILDGLAPPPRHGDLTNSGMYYGADEELASYNSRTPPASMGISKWGSDDNWFKKVANHLLEHNVPDSLLESSLRLTVKEDIDDWKDDILSQDGAIAIRNLEKNGAISSLELIAAADAPPRKLIKYAMELEDSSVSVARVKKVGADRYDIWLSGDKPEELAKISANLKETKRIVESIQGSPSDEDMKQVERSGERIFSAIRWDKPDKMVDLTEEPEGATSYVEAGSDFRKVNVFQPKTRASMKGWLLGKVIYPSGKPNDHKLFINKDYFSYQPSILVDYMDGTVNDSRIAGLNFSYPRAGEWGTFVSNDDQDKGTGMVPFKVLSVISEKDGNIAVRVETVNGNRVAFVPFSNAMTIRPVNTTEARRLLGVLNSPGELTYILPRRFQYVSLGSNIDVISSKDDLKKEASVLSQTEVIHDAGLYHLRGYEVNRLPLQKWGYQKTSMSDIEAFHTLISLGCMGDNAELAIKQATEKGKAVAVSKRKPYALSKNAQTKESILTYGFLEKELKELRNEIRDYSILKIASTIPDVATVNNVLSLRFIGPETFHNFASNIPTVEKTLSFLCTLLLSSRIDSTLDLEEQEISTAIRLLDNTLQRIKKMRAIISPV